jgi:hypothetical protein
MNSLDRRSFLAYFSAIGMTSTLFPGALWALAESKPKIERSMIDEAADIAGVEIKDEYKEMMLKDLNEQVQGYDEIRKLNIPNSVPPALVFDPDGEASAAHERGYGKGAAAHRGRGVPQGAPACGADAHQAHLVGSADGDVLRAHQAL